MEVDATELGKDSVACCRFHHSDFFVGRFEREVHFSVHGKGRTMVIVTGSDGVAL